MIKRLIAEGKLSQTAQGYPESTMERMLLIQEEVARADLSQVIRNMNALVAEIVTAIESTTSKGNNKLARRFESILKNCAKCNAHEPCKQHPDMIAYGYLASRKEDVKFIDVLAEIIDPSNERQLMGKGGAAYTHALGVYEGVVKELDSHLAKFRPKEPDVL